jgi:ABC-2 type transport system permease protein
MWLRQIKRYFRSRSRIIGSLGQPILYLIALGYGFGSLYAKAGQGNYLQFLAPGIIAMTILFTAVFSGIEIIWDRQFGFLKETLVAPVSRLSIMLGRTIGGASVATFQGVLFLVIALFFGFRPEWAYVIPGIIFMIGIALVFTAFGTAIASVIEDMQGFQLIMNFVIMPTFFLSNALFPLDTAPAAIRFIASINPLTYGVDGLRWAFMHNSHFSVWTDAGVLAGFSIVFIAFGAYLFSRIKA